MRIGTQYENVGSKYPFAEDSVSVSLFPLSSWQCEADKIPCDLFSDVVIDYTQPGYELVFLGHDSSSGGRFVFELLKDSARFDEPVQFQIESSRFKTGYCRVPILGKIAGGETIFIAQIEGHHFTYSGNYSNTLITENILKAAVHFDPHCHRFSEPKLTRFDIVHSDDSEITSVTGDVIFEAGYNTNLNSPAPFDFINKTSLQLDFTAGSGLGKVPCGLFDSDDSSDLPPIYFQPDEYGKILFSSPDSCYSFTPVSGNVLRMDGHCSACCNCEDDYVPTAQIVVGYLDAISKLFEKFDLYNRRYTRYIAACRKYLASQEKEVLSWSSSLQRSRIPDAGRLRYELNVVVTNKAAYDIELNDIYIQALNNNDVPPTDSRGRSTSNINYRYELGYNFVEHCSIDERYRKISHSSKGIISENKIDDLKLAPGDTVYLRSIFYTANLDTCPYCTRDAQSGLVTNRYMTTISYTVESNNIRNVYKVDKKANIV